jgi:hypothetical protein
MEENKNNQTPKPKAFGKVVKLPKGGDAVSFMENIKIPRNKYWYLLVEKQDDELHMIKYNEASDVELTLFVAELKKFYMDMFEGQEDIKNLVEQMNVVGNDKFSIIKNIPSIKIGDKNLVNKISSDLIKLLK